MNIEYIIAYLLFSDSIKDLYICMFISFSQQEI